MRILVISDIHANLTAFEAVLQAAGPFDAAWCLGDLVGYGPDLNECVELVQTLPNPLCVKGNHDLAICSSDNLDIFNNEAGESILISRKIISTANIEFLQTLPEVITNDLATLVHGSPQNPIWEYILDTYTANLNFALVNTPLIFVGHSHLPLMFTRDKNGKKVVRHFPKPGVQTPLTRRAILNPGSVGQPRDNDPRASFGIFDPEAMTWEIHRVDYDIASVQERIIRAGLPEKHARRLSAGW